MTSLAFTKMHGLGNDFAVINALNQTVSVDQLPLLRLSHRHLGIGFDQLLIIRPSTVADFYCQIINSDGSEAEQCGNGLRCVARFIIEEGLSQQQKLTIETKAGVFAVAISDFQAIEVTMGIPQVINLNHVLSTPETWAQPLAIISMGNPHAILSVPAIETADVLGLGSVIESHSDFPLGINVGFMEIVNRQHIRLRTYERGAGETLACGSNACAAVVTGVQRGKLDSHVKVELIFGDLFIDWNGENQALRMTGPAFRVYSGSFVL